MKNLIVLMLALIATISVSAQETSTADENIAAVKKFMGIINQSDWMDHASFLFTPEQYESFKQVHSEFREVFPDYHYKLLMISAKGDSVFTLGEVTGTHTKTWNLFPDIPGTGKKISWLETGVIIIKDGKSVDGLILNDRFWMMNQLGYKFGCKPEPIKL